MLAVESLPKTYHARVNWYVSHWSTNVIHVFRTKFEALQYAKDTCQDGINCLDWFSPATPLHKAISSTAKFVDHRN